MSLESLRAQLEKINSLLPNIERFEDGKLMDLPEVYRKELNQITIIPQFTTSGIESMVGVLNYLYSAQYYAKKTLGLIEVKTPAPKPVSAKPVIQPNVVKSVLSKPIKKPIPSTPPIPAIPTNPPASPSPQKVVPTSTESGSRPPSVGNEFKKESPLDLGPYSK